MNVYFIGNYYIYIRGFEALPNDNTLKIIYTLVFAILSVSFAISRFTGKKKYFKLHKITTWIGSFWLAAALYFFISVLLIDIVRIINSFFQLLPLAGSENYNYLKLFLLCMIVLLTITALIIGNYKARHSLLKYIDIRIAKKSIKYKTLKIAMVSDIHLGTIVNEKYLKRLSKKINSEKPDLILLVGDLVDEELSPVLRYDIGKPLRMLKAGLGVWAVAGNHEHIGNFRKASDYIKSLNINLLIDEIVLIDESFYLIGRNDKDSKRFGNNARKDLSEIMQNVDQSKPIIMMDHQPSDLNEAIANSVDLQLSGHTHNGQFFPFNLITKKIFELSYGYLKKGKTHFYVSSGFGSWGPPVRLGSNAEIVFIRIHFE